MSHQPVLLSRETRIWVVYICHDRKAVVCNMKKQKNKQTSTLQNSNGMQLSAPQSVSKRTANMSTQMANRQVSKIWGFLLLSIGFAAGRTTNVISLGCVTAA
jgi:hypothetical protein